MDELDQKIAEAFQAGEVSGWDKCCKAMGVILDGVTDAFKKEIGGKDETN